MANKQPNWTKTGTVEGYAEWLRGKSDALCVIVVRPFDAVLVVDQALSPSDCSERITEELPELIANLREAREQKKKASRIQHAPCSE